MTTEPAPRLDDTTDDRWHHRRLLVSLRDRVDTGLMMTALAGVLVAATMGAGIVQAVSPRNGQSMLPPESGLTTTAGDVTMTFPPERGGGPGAPIGAYPTPDASAAPQSAAATAAGSTRPRASSVPAPPPPAPASRPAAAAVMSVVAYEAEDPANSRSAGTWLRAVKGASGGHVIGYLGKGNLLQFTSVNVPVAGTYSLTVYYIAGDPRAGILLINDRSATAPRFSPTPNWDTVGSVTVSVSLVGGRNTIKIGNPWGYAPDIDRIVVR